MSFSRLRPGFCYVRWFLQLGFIPEDLSDCVRRLGSYPRVCDVLALCVSKVSSLYVSMYDVIRLGDVLHVDVSVPVTTLLDLLITWVGTDYRVGADNGVSDPSVGVDFSVAANVLRSMGVEVESLVKEHIVGELRKPDSLIRNQLIDSVSRRTATVLREGKKGLKEVIPYRLSSVEQMKLESSFPELNLCFSGTRTHPHAFSAAHRLCETQVCLRSFDYRTDLAISDDFQCVVKDFGGNFFVHLMRNRLNIHSCCPILDARDALRFSTRLASLNQIKVSRGKSGVDDKKFQKFFSDETFRRAVVCNRKAQQCFLRAPYALMIHSNYDFRPRDLADALDISGVRMCSGTFLFCSKIIEDDVGVVDGQNCRWEKIREPGRRQRIRFTFKHDSSLEYEHDYETYIFLATGHVLESSLGAVFFVEIKEVKNGVMFFSICRNLAPEVPRSRLSHCIWNDDEGLVAVEYFSFVATRDAVAVTDAAIALKRKIFLAPERLVEFGKAYALGLTQNKFTVANIYDYLRSLNQRFVVNGTDVLNTEKKLGAVLLFDLAYAIYVFAFNKRYENSLVLNAILEDEKTAREFDKKSFWSRVYLKCLAFFKTSTSVLLSGSESFSTNGQVSVPEKESMGWFSRLCVWACYERKFPVRLDKAVTFHRFEDVFEKFIQCGTTIERVAEFELGRDYVHADDREFLANVRETVGDALDVCLDVMLDQRNDGVAKVSMSGGVDECVCPPINGVECTDKHLRLVRIPGDGQCCFSALLRACAMMELSVSDLRLVLSLSPFLRFLFCPDDTKALLRDSSRWGDDEVIRLFCMHFRKNVCIHNCSVDGVISYVRYVGDAGVSRFSHLKFTGCHYDAFVSDDCCVNDDVKNELLKSVPEVLVDVGSDVKSGDDSSDDQSVDISTGGSVERYYGCLHQPVSLNLPPLDCFDVVDVVECENGVSEKRELLSAYDESVLSDARFRANPAEKLEKGCFLNRSAFKLVEVCKRFGLLRSEDVLYDCVDLCGAPGGMLQYLMLRKNVNRIFSVSKSCGSSSFSYMFNSLPKIDKDVKILSFCSGDLCKSEVVKAMCSMVLRDCEAGVDLVVADGGVDVGDCEKDQETLNYDLIRNEALCALNVLKSGGCFVLKVYDLFSIETKLLLLFLRKCFSSSYIYKPVSSRAASSEKFFIGKGFLKDKFVAQEELKFSHCELDSFSKMVFPLNKLQNDALASLIKCCEKSDVDFRDASLVRSMRGFLGRIGRHCPTVGRLAEERNFSKLWRTCNTAVLLRGGQLLPDRDLCFDDRTLGSIILCDLKFSVLLPKFFRDENGIIPPINVVSDASRVPVFSTDGDIFVNNNKVVNNDVCDESCFSFSFSFDNNSILSCKNFSESSISFISDCAIPYCCDCDEAPVVSNVVDVYDEFRVFKGVLSSNVVFQLRKFISDLPCPVSDDVSGVLGKRREWLYADVSYSYGRRTVSPVAGFSVCKGFVRRVIDELGMGLKMPNALLLVYYPPGTSGLRLHADDEPVHASDQVITLCMGAAGDVVLSDLRRRVHTRFEMHDGEFYVFSNQEGFLHGVESIDQSDSAGRWAFTFRVFKDDTTGVRTGFRSAVNGDDCFIPFCVPGVCVPGESVLSFGDECMRDCLVCGEVDVECVVQNVVEDLLCNVEGVLDKPVVDCDVDVDVDVLSGICDDCVFDFEKCSDRGVCRAEVCVAETPLCSNVVSDDSLCAVVSDVCVKESGVLSTVPVVSIEKRGVCEGPPLDLVCDCSSDTSSGSDEKGKKKEDSGERVGEKKKKKRRKIKKGIFGKILKKIKGSTVDVCDKVKRGVVVDVKSDGVNVGVVVPVANTSSTVEPRCVERVMSSVAGVACKKRVEVDSDGRVLKGGTVAVELNLARVGKFLDDIDLALIEAQKNEREKLLSGGKVLGRILKKCSPRSAPVTASATRSETGAKIVKKNCHPTDASVLSGVLCGTFCPVETPIVSVWNEKPTKIGCMLLMFDRTFASKGKLKCFNSMYPECVSDIEDFEKMVLERFTTGALSHDLFCVVQGRCNISCVICVFSTEQTFFTDFPRFMDIFPTVYTSPLVISLYAFKFRYRSDDCILEVLSQYDANAYKHRFQIFVLGDKSLYKILSREIEKFCKFPLRGTKASSSMYEHWQRPNVDRVKDCVFKPAYVCDTSPVGIARNAMIEQLELWRVREYILLNEHKSFYSALPLNIDSNARDKIQMSGEGYGLYSLREKRFVVSPRCAREKYEYAFDGTRFVGFDRAVRGEIQVCNDRLLVSNNTELMQDLRLYEACRGLSVDAFELPSVSLKQGVPGCGKTTYILKNYVPPGKGVVGDLVLFPTREGVEDFRMRACKLDSSVKSFEKKNFRTLHSFLLNSNGEVFERLIVDEALMMHAGELMFAAFRSGCKEVILVGDQNQIPYINRTPQCEVRFSDPMKFACVSEVLSVTYRCTLTVAALLYDKYDGGMRATSSVFGEMSVVPFTCLADVPNEKGVKYLTFKQSEKIDLKKLGFDVSTIHEFQGKQAENVCVVRLSRKKEDIYNREAHALVAITRHTKSFRYITPVSDDAISKFVRRSALLDFSQRKRAQVDLGGGFREDYIPVSRVLADIRRPALKSENIYSCVGKWGYADIPCSVPVSFEKEFSGYVPSSCLLQNYCDNVQVLQDFYDRVLPGNSIFSYVYDSYNVLNACDLNVHLEDTSIDLGRRFLPRNIKYDKLRPVLRTSMAPARPSNQVETLLAMIKRNQNVPDICGDVCNATMSDIMVKNFVKTFIPLENRECFMSFRDSVVEPNSASITEWLSTQKPIVHQQIVNEKFFAENPLTLYNFMVKSSVKPQLDTGAPFVYSSLQTIAYHPKNINVIFCPIFKEVKRRLLSVLDPRFLLFCDVSPEEFAETLSKRFNADYIRGLKKLEIDISKYDKSQGALALEFEIKLLRLFGVSEEILVYWRNAHEVTTLWDRINGVKCKVLFQRKSGDASTYLGNTLFLMAVICSLFDLSSVDMALFSGDDSLIVGGNIDFDRNQECALLFNLESKFFRNYFYMYFCSKFLLCIDGVFYFIPDPVKLITKLGRSDLVNYDHVEEYRVSMFDLTKGFANALINEELSAAVNERYLCDGFHGNVFSVIHNLTSSREAFSSLFYQREGDNLCFDVSRPSLKD